MKSGFYTTSGVDQLNVWIEKRPQSTSQSQTCTKKLISVWWSATLLIHYSFLNPGDTITSEMYAQQSMRCTKKCKACSRHLSTKRAQFFSPTMLNTLHNQCFKSWTNWAMKFCLICHIHLTSCQLTTTSSSISTFSRENASTTSRTQKMLSKSLSNPKACFLYAIVINKHFLLAKIC